MSLRPLTVRALKLWHMLLTRLTLATGTHTRVYLGALTKLQERDSTQLAIAFLCTGNICRSPFAAVRFAALCSSGGHSVSRIDSFGLETANGKRADATTLRLAPQFGASLDSHRTKVALAAELAEFDLLVVMEPLHLLRIRTLSPELEQRTLLLGALLAPERKNPQIPDPFAQSEARFLEALGLIEAGLKRLEHRLFPPKPSSVE